MRSNTLISSVVQQRAEIESRTQVYLKSLAELDASDEWRAEGYVSVERCVAARTGAAMGAVCADVALARRLYGASAAALPLVAAAVESGEINLDHARAIERETRFLDGAVVADVESAVVEQAKRLAPTQLGQACDRAKRLVLAERKREDEAAASRAADLAAREQAARDEAAHRQQEHDSRYLRISERGRMTFIEALLPTVEAEMVKAVLVPLAQPRPVAADDPVAQPDSRTHGQRFADALVQMASRFTATDHESFLPGPLATIHVITEITDVERVGYLPSGRALDSDQMQRLSCDAEITATLVRRTPHGGLDAGALDRQLIAISPALGGTRFEILEQGRSQRRATAAQRKALRVRDRGCVFPGCTAPFEWTEAHHTKHWSEGGNTDLDDLASLCCAHHQQIHTNKWRLRSDDHGASWWIDKTRNNDRGGALPEMRRYWNEARTGMRPTLK